MLSWPRRPIIYEINTLAMAPGAEPARAETRHVGDRPDAGMGCARFVWVRCGLAHGRVGTESCRHPDREREYRTSGRVRTSAIRLSTGGQRRICLLRPSLRRGRSTRRTQRVGDSQKTIGRSWHAIDSGFCSEPRRARPSVDHGSSAVFHSRHGRRPGRETGEFFKAGSCVVANGRDPYFPPWPDVAQLNAFSPALRQAALSTVLAIADQCDGMRCDMAMLMMNPIFERTWGSRAGQKPGREYWVELIRAVRERYPKVLFVAEAYWDLEWELQQQGFNYCYDKRLYDRLEHGPAEQVRLHLCAELAYQEKLVRFIENHDEPRAAATFGYQKARAVAVTFATAPGAKLFHEGQFEGYRVRLPVFLRRRPEEVPDRDLRGFYKTLLQTIRSADFRDGEWTLCERIGLPDNGSYLNLVAWCWEKSADRHLIVVNLSEVRSQARVKLPWADLAGRSWRLTDPLQQMVFERAGDELREAGLYVDLEPWGYHVLSAESH